MKIFEHEHIYLTLYNQHNGYYAHGFSMEADEGTRNPDETKHKILWKGKL